METGDTALAISSFRTCVEQDPTHYKGFMQLGVLHSRLGDPLAMDYYNTAIELRPRETEAWYNKAMFAQENGMDSLALECYDRIKQLDPRNALAWYNSGYVRLEHLNDPQQAIRDLTAAGKLEPKYYQAFYNRGLAYERKGVLDSAAMDHQRALKIKPDYAPAAEGLSRLQRMGVRIVKDQ
jgi:tetratricopeptide (TPR) repeat protein